MLLLLFSILLVLASAFFIANIFDSKNLVNNIICFFIAAFSNVVITFEILSLFSGISPYNVIALNIIFALLAGYVWYLKGAPTIKVNLRLISYKIINSIKLDKTIAILICGFIFAIIISFALILIMQGMDVDSTTYRVVRALFWVEHGNLNHFYAADPRMLMFPINSEILYSWFILFLKSDLWLFIFNFCGVGLFLTVLYGLLSELKFSFRRKLWTCLITASIPFVILRYTGIETGLLIAALVLSVIYLYILYLNNKKLSFCFLSSLALALGVGTKTTVILLMPVLLIWCVWFSILRLGKTFYRPIIKFSVLFIINFLLFASYNYILNYINYGHFISALNISLGHTNTDGILSTFSNLYRYIFDFFSFPEYLWSADLSSSILKLREGLLNSLNANTGLGYTNVVYPYVAHSVSSASAGLGFFGPLLFIPAYIISIYKSCRCKNYRSMMLVSFVYLFLGAVLVMAYKLAFMSFNIRFLFTFAMLTVPVIAYMYSKKYSIYKLLITVIAFVYLITLPGNVTIYPCKSIIKAFSQGATLEKLHTITECSFLAELKDINKYDIKDVSCMVSRTINRFNPRNKILYFANSDDSLMPIKRLMFKGYRIDLALASEIDKVNLNEYNIIIIRNDSQSSTTLFLKDKKLDEYGYIYKNGIACSYIAFDGDIIRNLEREKNNIDTSQCYFDKSFVDYYNLRLIDKTTYRVGVEPDGSIKRKTYKVYENMNNPLLY